MFDEEQPASIRLTVVYEAYDEVMDVGGRQRPFLDANAYQVSWTTADGEKRSKYFCHNTTDYSSWPAWMVLMEGPSGGTFPTMRSAREAAEEFVRR